ncbi:vegetative cell wall protein gp1-like [Glycine soja]|uniref:vegetative cell wall protein gp1-like n=1 Tax=Glycine max TaxID=3847 RepID=UPI0003DE9DC0|nr:vegetative cell wall protein gp1-like [Glycine max]XP_028242099.1 vegetative cell wall protein gp1-like [Glycine soja]|eukprot:XP_006584212.1 vegetative cell wall protein gp1-like [Glycine max]
MSSGGVDPPRPPSHDSSGKGTTAKKRRYMVRLLPPRDSLTSSIPSPSSMSIPVRPLDVAPTPSPPSTKARPSSSHVNARGPSPIPASTPFPSSVDAHGPSPLLTSTPSPSPPVGNMPTDEDAINLSMEDPL